MNVTDTTARTGRFLGSYLVLFSSVGGWPKTVLFSVSFLTLRARLLTLTLA